MRFERIALDKLYKRRDRYEVPDWQRSEVWSVDKQQKLIDSILRGYKLPKFYLQKAGENPPTYEVVDGQQRLRAIWDFRDNELELTDETAELVNGARQYKDLPDTFSDAFDDFEIEYDLIVSGTDEEVRDFFQRLQEGLPLTSSEKLNSIVSKLRNFTARVSQHEFFKNSTVAANRRHAYFDVVAKVMALELEGLDTGLRFDDLSQVFKSNVNFSPSSAAAKRVRLALDLLHQAFPEKSPVLRQRSMIQSVITLTAHLLRAGMEESQITILRDFIEQFSAELTRQVELGQEATDVDYLAFQRTVNANIKVGARIRHEILLRKLFALHPDFFGVLTRSRELQGTLAQDVARLGTDVASLIHSINERYAAANGVDLFKPTNKTLGALATGIGKPVNSEQEYQFWIDDLYFLFRESVGQRLSGSMPDSFVDVNDLRTSLQHDVDHGKGVEAKRKRLASKFAKYAGVTTPDALPPDQFPLMQANLLGALVADLRALARSLA